MMRRWVPEPTRAPLWGWWRGWSGGLGAEPSAGYLEATAKSFGAREPSAVRRCPGWFCMGLCEDGHQWAKELYCGREWCSSCRGLVHRRRMARWWDKAQQLHQMGYLVVTFPPEDRQGLRAKVDLAEVGKVATVGVRELFPRGLRRWHFFGEDHGAGIQYHPHLNYLVDGARLRKAELRPYVRT